MPSRPSAPPGLNAPMLKKRFSSPKELPQVRHGLRRAARRRARRSSVHGRAARTNGRISLRITGSVCAQERDHGLVRLVELPDRLAQRLERRAQHRRELAAPSPSALSEARSDAGSWATDAEIASSSFASASNTVREAVTSRRRSCGWLAQLGHQQAVVVDQLLERDAAPRARARHAGEVAMDRLEAAEHLAQVVAAAVEALAGAGHEQLQVRARVGVERGVDLVGVDVRQRVRHRGSRPPSRKRLAACPGSPRGTCPSARSSAAAARSRRCGSGSRSPSRSRA